MTEKNTVPKSSTSKSNYFCWTSLYDTIMCGEALKEKNAGRKSFRSSVPYNSLYSEGEVAAVQCGEEAWAKVQEVGAEVQEEAGAKGQEEVGAEVKEEEWVEVQEEVGAEGLEEAGAECKEEEWVEVQEEVGVECKEEWVEVQEGAGAECKEEEWVEVQEEVWAEGLEEAGAECKEEEWVVVQDKAGVVAEWVAAGDVETAVLVVSCPRIPGCINCPFNNNCTRCNPPLSLLSTGQRAQCVRTCPFRFSRMNVNGSFVCQWRGSLEGCLDSMCSGCKNGYYYLEKDGRFCHKSCPKGYFVSYGRCLKCLKSCESCSTAIKCEKCKKGLFKVRMPSRPQSAICVPECPQGYKGIVVNETSEQICQKVCHVTHCQSCESDSYHGQRHCDVCSPGYNKHKIYAKLGFGVIYDDECRKECPKGYQVEMNKLGGTECVKQIVKRPGPGIRDSRACGNSVSITVCVRHLRENVNNSKIRCCFLAKKGQPCGGKIVPCPQRLFGVLDALDEGYIGTAICEKHLKVADNDEEVTSNPYPLQRKKMPKPFGASQKKCAPGLFDMIHETITSPQHGEERRKESKQRTVTILHNLSSFRSQNKKFMLSIIDDFHVIHTVQDPKAAVTSTTSHMATKLLDIQEAEAVPRPESTVQH
ncbi:predicted protein [Nematostella vectensis]|uniref:Uncharacterized protein n=1 Tax=Nematostella vectensis TaxID=45351 RepID=A7SQH1_NEMVE|nr:predicted protein [Nematostella vectensis]|eukprot:XP_001626124.1 predicted protein [Nematostella vectensis]